MNMRTVPIPDENARLGPTLTQKLVLVLLLLALVHGFISYRLERSLGLFYFISGLYFCICCHKLALVISGVVRSREMNITEIEILSHGAWPVYTILLPVYREKEIFPQLFRAIENLDYPKDRLEVILLMEEDDPGTREAAQEWSALPWVKTLVVPDRPPKTKGKALNYGLQAASGKYLVIYDAEDIPERDQLKKAVIAFEKAPERVVCFQAKLNYYNPYQNFLTRWFTAEYSSWFDLYLPGIDSIGAPIPLGGTSNHFRTGVLQQLKGWDPFNVTEDCDLGMRIVRAGHTTGVLDSTTWEEANSELGNWIKQRSRWVKGYIQTYCVHMRNPARLLREIGVGGFIHFNLIVGGNFFVLCVNPLAWGFLLYWLMTSRAIYFPNPFFMVVTPVLLAANLFFIMMNVLGSLRRKYYRLLGPALLSPVYWVLMSAGAWKGLGQLFYRPHYWEKTDHALFLDKTYH